MSGIQQRIDENCIMAIKDIQNKWKKKGVELSFVQASQILGEDYFKLRDSKKPIILQEYP